MEVPKNQRPRGVETRKSPKSWNFSVFLAFRHQDRACGCSCVRGWEVLIKVQKFYDFSAPFRTFAPFDLPPPASPEPGRGAAGGQLGNQLGQAGR